TRGRGTLGTGVLGVQPEQLGARGSLTEGGWVCGMGADLGPGLRPSRGGAGSGTAHSADARIPRGGHALRADHRPSLVPPVRRATPRSPSRAFAVRRSGLTAEDTEVDTEDHRGWPRCRQPHSPIAETNILKGKGSS